jgi:hypothetical protein
MTLPDRRSRHLADNLWNATAASDFARRESEGSTARPADPRAPGTVPVLPRRGGRISRMALVIAILGTTAWPASAETRTFEVGGFDRIAASSAADIRFTAASRTSVVVDGDSAAIDALDIRTEANTLIVGQRRGVRWPRRARATVLVSAPALTGGSVSGSGDLGIDQVMGATFDGLTEGSGNLRIDTLRVRRATLAASGSGNITAGGSVDVLEAEATGSGNVDARTLNARSARVTVEGSGNVDAHASDEAEAKSSGSGNATVTGGARCTARATGSGLAICR